MSLLAKIFKRLSDYAKEESKKNFRSEKVRCCRCGHRWNCVFPNVQGGEYKLKCPKCGARDSEVIYK